MCLIVSQHIFFTSSSLLPSRKKYQKRWVRIWWVECGIFEFDVLFLGYSLPFHAGFRSRTYAGFRALTGYIGFWVNLGFLFYFFNPSKGFRRFFKITCGSARVCGSGNLSSEKKMPSLLAFRRRLLESQVSAITEWLHCVKNRLQQPVSVICVNAGFVARMPSPARKALNAGRYTWSDFGTLIWDYRLHLPHRLRIVNLPNLQNLPNQLTKFSFQPLILGPIRLFSRLSIYQNNFVNLLNAKTIKTGKT